MEKILSDEDGVFRGPLKHLCKDFVTWVRNSTKTAAQFAKVYKLLKQRAMKIDDARMTSFLLYLKRVKNLKHKWARYNLCGANKVTDNNEALVYGDLVLV